MKTLPSDGRCGETICGETEVGENGGEVILVDACELRGDAYDPDVGVLIPGQDRRVGDSMLSILLTLTRDGECKCSEFRLLFALLERTACGGENIGSSLRVR